MKLNNKNIFLIWIPLSIFILNFVLKIIHLGTPDLYNDEPFSVYFAQRSVIDIINILAQGNNPPFFEIILHFWIKVFGTSEFSVRFLSMLFSCITAVFIYFIGLKHLNKETGIVAALIFTFSQGFLFYAQEARVYSLFVMLTTISLFLFLNIIKETNKKTNYIWLIITNIILIYSHFFGFWVLFMQFISTYLWKSNRKTIGKPMIIVWFSVFILYLPYLLTFIHRFIASLAEPTWVTPAKLRDPIYYLLETFGFSKLTVLSLLILYLLSFYKWNKKPINNQIISLWFLVPYLTIFLLSYEKNPFNIPMFILRYTLFTSIPFIITATTSIFEFKIKYTFQILIAFLLIGIVITHFKPISRKATIEKVIIGANNLSSNHATPIILHEDFAAIYSYYTNNDLFTMADVIPPLAQINVHSLATTASCEDLKKFTFSDSLIFISRINEEGTLRENVILFLRDSFPNFTSYYYQNKSDDIIKIENDFINEKDCDWFDRVYYVVIFRKQE